jgi:hypothetical protein
MNFQQLWNRVKEFFTFRCIRNDNIPHINLDDDILESEYGNLNDSQNPNNYF